MSQTLFSKHSVVQFTNLFRARIWNQLTPQMKHQACQELENRLAAERNSVPRTIVAERMEGACYGYQSGNKIYINQNLLESGRFVTYDEITGAKVNDYQVDAAGWQIFDTICHEDEHGAQYDRGDAQSYRSYITCNTDSVLYRIQKDEASAFAIGNMRTLDAIELQKNTLGEIEPDMMAYVRDIKADRYQDALSEAQIRYHDENIKATLDQAISDAENGESGESPSGSYHAIRSLINQQNHSNPQNYYDEERSALFKPFNEQDYINPEFSAQQQGISQPHLPAKTVIEDGSELFDEAFIANGEEQDDGLSLISERQLSGYEAENDGLSLMDENQSLGYEDEDDGLSLMEEGQTSDYEVEDDGLSLMEEGHTSDYEDEDEDSESLIDRDADYSDFQDMVDSIRNDCAGYPYGTDYNNESIGDQSGYSDSTEYSSGQGMSR